MPGSFLRIISLVLACFTAIVSSASAADRPAVQQLREEIWALMTPLPLFAYVVRPVGGGPYPLLIMNHGISGDPEQRGDRKSTRLNSSHANISYAVFCLKKKNTRDSST